jgi:hypothetical protein
MSNEQTPVPDNAPQSTEESVDYDNKMGVVDYREILQRTRRDPGAIARERVVSRGNRVKVALVRTYLLITLVIFLGIGGLAKYGHMQYVESGMRYSDYRPCKYENEKHGVVITGRRSYSYMQHSVFGFQFRDMSKVDEQTQIDVTGDSITVVGMSPENWWSLYVGPGERGIQILKPAQTYVFTSDKKAAVVNYNDFCR